MNLIFENRKRVPRGILASSSIVFGILYLSIAIIHILDRYLRLAGAAGVGYEEIESIS